MKQKKIKKRTYNKSVANKIQMLNILNEVKFDNDLSSVKRTINSINKVSPTFNMEMKGGSLIVKRTNNKQIKLY